MFANPTKKSFIAVLIVANIVSLTLSAVLASALVSWSLIEEESLAFFGIACGQAAMLGGYLACAYQPFAFRIRWFLRLFVIQWICLTVPFLTDKLHRQFPWCVLADQVLVAAPAFLVMGGLRLFSRCGVIIDNDAANSKSKFRIVDLIILTTLVALVIAITMRFTKEPTGWEGLLYVVMLASGVYVGCPVGCILPLLLSGFLAESKRTLILTAILWIFVLSVALFLLMNIRNWDRQWLFSVLELCVAGLAIALANTFALRWYGYRFRRLPQSGVKDSVQQ
jgi:hypothetical protein